MRNLKSRIEALRLQHMQQLGFWVTGPIAMILVLYAISSDFKLYPEAVTPVWIVLRVLIVPISILSMIFLRWSKTKAFADFAAYFVALYLAAFHAYFVTQTGFESSKYFHSFVQILFGAALVPLRQLSFLATASTIIGLYVATVFIGSGSFAFLMTGDAEFLKTYVLMAFLLFYSFRYARNFGYRANIDLEDELGSRAKEIERLVATELFVKEAETRIAISRQVSHDIRSPLSALNMIIGSLPDLPEEKRVVLKSATQRINDIASQLLAKSRAKAPAAPEPLASAVELLISEKRAEVRGRPNLSIEADLSKAHDVFARIDSGELKRALSNLLNNAIEACATGYGQVSVAVSKAHGEAQIVIKDNGRGIPAEILNRLGESGVTFAKPSGNGLGIPHAKETITKCGGKLEILSQVGLGTSVCISLPLAEPGA